MRSPYQRTTRKASSIFPSRSSDECCSEVENPTQPRRQQHEDGDRHKNNNSQPIIRENLVSWKLARRGTSVQGTLAISSNPRFRLKGTLPLQATFAKSSKGVALYLCNTYCRNLEFRDLHYPLRLSLAFKEPPRPLSGMHRLYHSTDVSACKDRSTRCYCTVRC